MLDVRILHGYEGCLMKAARSMPVSVGGLLLWCSDIGSRVLFNATTLRIVCAGVGRAVAAFAQRKVRAPQDKVPGNAWGARAHGQCHRKHTADGLRAQVRVKRCGKSAPRQR